MNISIHANSKTDLCKEHKMNGSDEIRYSATRRGRKTAYTIINENECTRRARVMCKNVARNNQRAQFGDIINDTTTD